MSKISQKDSQAEYPQEIRKLLRLGNAYAVTLPPAWVRSFNPGPVHYLTVHRHSNGSVVIRDLPAAITHGLLQDHPLDLDRPPPRPQLPP